MSILIVGRRGQLARALIQQSGADTTAVGRPDIDLEKPETIEAEILRRKPEIVVNAAAYTAVDRAEEEPQRAFQVNASGVESIARASAHVGAALVHISTDYVFNGSKMTAYVEDDEPDPQSVYGASKLEGERRAIAANPRTVILRTAWVYDAQGANFVRTMLRLAATRPELNVVTDQVGCPTLARDLAEATLAVARNLQQGSTRYGIYHCAGGGETSWFELARTIFARSQDLGGPSANARPVTTMEYRQLNPQAKAPRPANSRLDCSKLAGHHGVRLRAWPEALGECLTEISVDGWPS